MLEGCRIRIESDGTSQGTRVFAGESEIEAIQSIDLNISVDNMAKANIEVLLPLSNIEIDGENVTIFESKKEPLDDLTELDVIQAIARDEVKKQIKNNSENITSSLSEALIRQAERNGITIINSS